MTRFSAAQRRPLILITPDCEGDSADPSYVIRANYADAIFEAGGRPLIMPYLPGDIAALVALCDGILITGAQPGSKGSPHRVAFETALIADALRAQRPTLGICNGMQLIGLYLGGTLIDVASPGPGTVEPHIPHATPDRPAHAIFVEPDSLLARPSDPARPIVNSLHRHALKGPGQFRIAARAPDGVTEAIEGNGPGFCLGVQWHPEYRLTELDRHVLAAFVAACAAPSAAHSVEALE